MPLSSGYVKPTPTPVASDTIYLDPTLNLNQFERNITNFQSMLEIAGNVAQGFFVTHLDETLRRSNDFFQSPNR